MRLRQEGGNVAQTQSLEGRQVQSAREIADVLERRATGIAIVRRVGRGTDADGSGL